MREDSEDQAEEEPEEPEAATLSARDAMALIAPNEGTRDEDDESSAKRNER
ncbi:MAG TPA: hypothetical protein VH968_08215 [Gaiellaceae bacterium]|jgi:hypothetical protein